MKPVAVPAGGGGRPARESFIAVYCDIPTNVGSSTR